jgi:hypothetical protein
MKDHEKRTPTAEGEAVGQRNEAAQQSYHFRLLLNQLRTSRVPQGLTPEQRTALVRAEEAIETYVCFFYAHGARPCGPAAHARRMLLQRPRITSARRKAPVP